MEPFSTDEEPAPDPRNAILDLSPSRRVGPARIFQIAADYVGELPFSLSSEDSHAALRGVTFLLRAKQATDFNKVDEYLRDSVGSFGEMSTRQIACKVMELSLKTLPDNLQLVFLSHVYAANNNRDMVNGQHECAVERRAEIADATLRSSQIDTGLPVVEPTVSRRSGSTTEHVGPAKPDDLDGAEFCRPQGEGRKVHRTWRSISAVWLSRHMLLAFVAATVVASVTIIVVWSFQVMRSMPISPIAQAMGTLALPVSPDPNAMSTETALQLTSGHLELVASLSIDGAETLFPKGSDTNVVRSGDRYHLRVTGRSPHRFAWLYGIDNDSVSLKATVDVVDGKFVFERSNRFDQRDCYEVFLVVTANERYNELAERQPTWLAAGDITMLQRLAADGESEQKVEAVVLQALARIGLKENVSVGARYVRHTL